MIQSAEVKWGYRKLLLHLCEAEAADRRNANGPVVCANPNCRRQNHRQLEEGQLPARCGASATLLEGGFLERAENVLVLAAGRGKSHFLCALGRELILRHGRTVTSRRPSNWCSNS